ncbi:PadR family transcriptional regulator [Rhodomicrobium sp.]|uniref:PadR family transcriptional regulator n=1 Tax=Rhodomicrobium sp. TaxID=2720632 RepID=UPI0039E56FAE
MSFSDGVEDRLNSGEHRRGRGCDHHQKWSWFARARGRFDAHKGETQTGERDFAGGWRSRGGWFDDIAAHRHIEGGDEVFGHHGRRGGSRHGGDWRDHPFGGRRGRHGRALEQGDLRWLVLDLIGEQPRHGYEIIKAIEDAFNGAYTPSPGVIYPTLTLLEETGLIVSETQGAKKLYSLTDQGRAELAARAQEVAAVRGRLAEARARFGAEPAPEMIRAMDNLRAAVQVRLSKGALSPEAVRAITAALDRAAGEIEQS